MSFSKNSQGQINSKLNEKNRMITYINNTNVKKFARKKCQKMFLEARFLALEKTFSIFCTNFLSLLYVISLAYKISHCLSANHNPEMRITMCNLHWCYTFALLLHLNCTALSQSQSSNFSCVLLIKNAEQNSYILIQLIL